MSHAERMAAQGYRSPDGHAYYDWDEEKAAQFVRRLEEIGAVHVFVSPDLAHMLVPVGVDTATMRGFVLTCDEALPPNSVVDALARRLRHPEVAVREE